MVEPVHKRNATIAKQLYLDAMDSQAEADDWHASLREARAVVAEALRASSYLRDIPHALERNGGHMLAFRHLMAPPKSQDQFKLRCPSWTKGSENKRRSSSPEVAGDAAKICGEWLDPAVGRWLRFNRKPTRSELRDTLLRAATLIAHKQVETRQRMRLANAQELAVVERLLAKGWGKLPSLQIDTRGQVPPRQFMHKTRFATNTATPQEVDIACGLQGTFVAAVECKVTNDTTNSVKRVNDVLKKANAWKAHWGSFVHTAAILQGVIKPADVQRLSDGDVMVFWSHDIDSFADWLASRL